MKVAVVGLGKLGAPLAALLAVNGHEVLGADLNAASVAALDKGVAPVDETGLQAVVDCAHAQDALHATTDIVRAAAWAEMILVIVPTPSGPDGTFLNNHVITAVTAIGRGLATHNERATVAIVSTVMPGSTDGPIRNVLERESKRQVGDRLGLGYMPEFIALGSVLADMTRPDMVLIGANDLRTGQELEFLSHTISVNDPHVAHMTVVNAEITKLAVNCFLVTKIAFANMIGTICEAVHGGDSAQVLGAVGADSRIGRKYLSAGGPPGGPCLPRDGTALARFAATRKINPWMLRAADKVNDHQIAKTAYRALRANPDTVGVLGLSYKPDTAVTEASLGGHLVDLLVEHTNVITYDPAANTGAFAAPDADILIAGADVIIVATPWPEFADLNYLDKPVIDVWNILPDGPNVSKVGRG